LPVAKKAGVCSNAKAEGLEAKSSLLSREGYTKKDDSYCGSVVRRNLKKIFNWMDEKVL